MTAPVRAPVLLVDDRREDLLLLETLLGGLDVEIHKARSGEEALVLLAERDYAVIVLDVRLGTLDGFETARRMRLIHGGRQTPLVFLTAYDTDPETISEAYCVGAVDYMQKPINPHVFRSKIAFFVDFYKRNAETTALQRQQIETMREVDRIKDQFLGVLSHELRTPLHYIIGCGSVLEDGLAGKLTEEQQGLVHKMMAGADALLALVNDVLDMSHIQSGRFKLHPDWVDFGRVVREAMDIVAGQAAEKRVVLRADVQPDLPLVWADDRRLIQVLLNLMGNAVKFTPQDGAIQVRVREEDGKVRCEIEDTGIGVPSDALPRLFEPFWQADMSSTRQVGGTGLGLAICKALVEAHGARLQVRSELERGSVFWFELAAPAV